LAEKKAVAAKDKEQIQRFKKTAKELGVDESGDKFERVFTQIVKTQKTKAQDG
jgi:hypothetical protein